MLTELLIIIFKNIKSLHKKLIWHFLFIFVLENCTSFCNMPLKKSFSIGHQQFYFCCLRELHYTWFARKYVHDDGLFMTNIRYQKMSINRNRQRPFDDYIQPQKQILYYFKCTFFVTCATSFLLYLWNLHFTKKTAIKANHISRLTVQY